MGVAKLDGNGVAREVLSAVGGICGCMPVVHRIREERQDGEDRLWPCCLDAFVQRIECLHGPSRASSGVSTCCCLFLFFCSGSLRRRASTRQKAGRKSPHEGELCYLAKRRHH